MAVVSKKIPAPDRVGIRRAYLVAVAAGGVRQFECAPGALQGQPVDGLLDVGAAGRATAGRQALQLVDAERLAGHQQRRFDQAGQVHQAAFR